MPTGTEASSIVKVSQLPSGVPQGFLRGFTNDTRTTELSHCVVDNVRAVDGGSGTGSDRGSETRRKRRQRKRCEANGRRVRIILRLLLNGSSLFRTISRMLPRFAQWLVVCLIEIVCTVIAFQGVSRLLLV